MCERRPPSGGGGGGGGGRRREEEEEGGGGSRADARQRGEVADAVKGEHRSVACCRGRFRDFPGVEPGTARFRHEFRRFWDSRPPTFLSSSLQSTHNNMLSFLPVVIYSSILHRFY